MQSTPQLFSQALFKQNLHRFWPILAAYLLFVLISSFALIMNYKYLNIITTETFISHVFGISEILGLVIAFFSIALAVAVYSYIHNSIATAMYNTLPYKRKTVFISNYVSGLFMLLVPLFVFFLLLVGIGLNYNCLDILGLLKWLFIFTSVSILLYSAAVTIGMLTGHIIAHIAFFGIANFFFIGMENLISYFLSEYLYGFVSAGSRTTGLMAKATPIIYASNLSNSVQIQNSWLIWIVYLLLGFFLTFLALKLYEKRRMENASDVIAIRQLNPIFKYGFTICSSLTFGLMLVSIFNLRNNFFLSLIMLLLAGMIGYFVAEMLLKKSYRVFNTYKGFLIYALILTIFSISVYNDWYGYAARLPDVNKVEAVAFSDTWLSYYAMNNLQADKNRVFLDEIPKLPDSLAVTYGNPIDKELSLSGNYRYVYRNAENLTPEEMTLLWSVIPGIYMEDESITDIYKLHTYLSENIKDIRNNYRSRDDSNWYAKQEHQYSHYNISIIYRFDNGKVKSYNFPVLMPKQATDKSDIEIYNQLASIAGSKERRAKKVATIDIAPENIRSITIDQNIRHYMEKFPQEFNTVTVPIDDTGQFKIAPEDYAGFVNALKADYLSMSNEEMLKLNHNNWGYGRFSIENLDLPVDNKYREQGYSLDIDYYHKNTLEFLKNQGYIDDELYEIITEYRKIISEKENPPRKISLA